MKREIILKGFTLEICKRKALDVIQLAEYARRKEIDGDEASERIFEFAMIISDSLKGNLERIPFWRVFKRLQIKRLIRAKNLLSILHVDQLGEYALEVFKEEGLTDDELENLKKKALMV
jgi:hypothetical protein